MKRTKRFKLFYALHWREKLLLLEMSVIVALLETGLRLWGLKRIVALLNKNSRKLIFSADEKVTVEKYKKLIFLVSRIFPFTGRCLARSLTIWWLLRRVGIETNLKIGMQKKNGKIMGHAWIEYNQTPLVYEKNVARKFTVFDNLVLSNLVEINK